jgi:glycosyltransferase involved in cell wall biosynthesis
MTHTISIVTPVYKPVAEYIAAAYDSICTQTMPHGWQWQWVIQEDGKGGDIHRMLPTSDKRISIGEGRWSGEPTTRNMCLSRAKGELIKVLDADDQLTPGTLERDISVLSENVNIAWTTCRVLDLLPDGSTLGFSGDPAPGPIGIGEVLKYWQTHDYRASVHPATLCMRTNLVLALGGWMALAGSGDTGLLLAANAITRGYFIPEVGMLYRKHPQQMTQQAGHTDEIERPARMAIIEARAVALARLWSQRSIAVTQ